MTTLRARQNEAEAAARLLAAKYANTTMVDTIICLNGCEVIGAYPVSYTHLDVYKRQGYNGIYFMQ